MAIGEFEEVGNVVRSFAADDATVVVGTAIDEALDGELRVTVVATGLGQQVQTHQLRSVQQAVQQRAMGGGGSAYSQGGGHGGAHNSGHSGSHIGGQGGNQGGGSYRSGNAQSPYANYDSSKPAVIRKNAHGAAQGTGPANNGHDVEYLDIPAFLRRQAD